MGQHISSERYNELFGTYRFPFRIMIPEKGYKWRKWKPNAVEGLSGRLPVELDPNGCNTNLQDFGRAIKIFPIEEITIGELDLMIKMRDDRLYYEFEEIWAAMDRALGRLFCRDIKHEDSPH